ncbi:MAG TPA: hypothetical protein ENH39_04705, partial [Gammaproteobacteria bacterium]|nr:hypothetical protein [Gammaproteobacteria bacterium]
NDIDIDGNRLRGHNPQIQLDLGAIAKGYAVSIGLQKMRDLGIKHALINAGGDLCGIGDRGQRPWRIGIRNPLGNGIIASLELGKDECVLSGWHQQSGDNIVCLPNKVGVSLISNRERFDGINF